MTTASPRQPNATTGGPVWPYPDLVKLTRHRNGQWCKKHKGRLHYFGKLDDPDAALARWRKEWPYIVRGEALKPVDEPVVAVTLSELVNLWLDSMWQSVLAGERSPATYRKYKAFGKKLVSILGHHAMIDQLGPSHFARVRRGIANHSIVYRSDFVTIIRGAFNWGVNNRVIARVPDFGTDFTGPGRAAMRMARYQTARQLIARDHLLMMLMAADPCFEAVLLLGINCGFKAMDVATLHDLTVDLDAALISGPRRKTAVKMLAPLWPETVASLREVMHATPPLLRTRDGLVWEGRGTPRVARHFAELRDALGLPPDCQHSWLRHNLRTIGGEVSRAAVRRIMGQRVGDELDEIYDHGNVEAVARRTAEHVRQWLFTSPSGSGSRGGSAPPAAAADRP